MAKNYSRAQLSTHSLQGSLGNWIHQKIVLFPLRTLLIITLLSCATSLIVIKIRSASINAQTDIWWTISLNLINGKGYSVCSHSYFPFCGPGNQVTASREPAPIFLFAVVAMLSKESLLAAIFTEIVLYITVIWGVFLLTRQWTNTRTALLAAFVWSLYPPALMGIHSIGGDLLATVGVTFGLYYVFRARKTEHKLDWLMAGLFLGLGVMSRSAVLIIVVAISVGLLLERWQRSETFKMRVLPSLLVLIIVMGMIVPWMIRNEAVLGKPILGSSLTGYNIYRHNYMLGTDDYFRYVGSKEGYQAVRALLTRRTDLLGTENEAQMDAVYRDEGVRIIRTYPARYLMLSVFRFFPLWFNWQVSEAYGTPSDIVDYLIMVVQSVLLFFAYFGLRGTARDSWPLWASVVATSLAYMLIDSQLRYLLPVMPLVISVSAKGATELMEKFLTH